MLKRTLLVLIGLALVSRLLESSAALPHRKPVLVRAVRLELGRRATRLDPKRTLDVAGSLIGLVVLSPLLAVIAILVHLTSPGPVFYRARRMGCGGKPFTLYKFRSMVVGADKAGPGVTGADDPRITPIGRILRQTKLDELPQLLNVLTGDMSLVGPRPEDPRYVAYYTPEEREVLNVRPGITSPASVQFRCEESLLSDYDWETQYIRDLMHRKLKLDLDYVQKSSVSTDVRIVLGTVAALVRR